MPQDQTLSGSPGTLYVVATPIGNLEDLSPRARRVLSEVSAVLCEDTRVGVRLLSALGIENRLERFDQHADPGRIRWVIERIESGETLALVSDAGTPAISDPGAALVAAADAAGVTVVPIPGPSALTAFLSASGFERGSPIFRGFYPRKSTEREAEAERITKLPFDGIFVWFESPERIEETITDLATRFPEAKAVAAKEITKIHERFYRGSLKEVASHIQSRAGTVENRGEWVIGLEWIAPTFSKDETDSREWEKLLKSLLHCGVSASRAAKEVSQVFGISKKPVYSKAIEWAGAENVNEREQQFPDDREE